MRNLVQRLIGLVATVVIIGLIAGVPVLLVNIGATISVSQTPSLGEFWDRLSRPDDGSLLLTVFVLAAWASWVFLAAAILLELVAKARGIRAPRLPGMHLPQGAARKLVGTAALLFITAPVAANATGGPAQTVPAHEIAASTTTAVSAPMETPAPEASEQAGRKAQHEEDRSAVEHIVRPGDTLWSLAEQYLGEGGEYPKIAAANTHLIDKPDFLQPGWVLHIPVQQATDTTPSVPEGHASYTVQPGDTLTQIAADRLGDPARYAEIVDASEGITQPGGARLTDPDVIDAGWTLAVPTGLAETEQRADTERGQGAEQKQEEPVEHVPPLPPPPPPVTDPAPTDQESSSATAGTVAQEELDHGGDLGRGTPAAQEQDSAVAAAAATDISQSERGTGASQDAEDAAPWLLTGLAGAGGLLAAGLWAGLRHRRAAQFRARRPGRAIATPGAELGPVEKTIVTVGPQASATVELLDEVLRRLVTGRVRAGHRQPEILAAELAREGAVLHLNAPSDFPAPWEGHDERMRWCYPIAAPVAEAGPLDANAQAPYPLLLPIGEGENGEVWLLNFEATHVVTLTGDETFTADFVRFLAAQAPSTPWGRDVTVDCVGVAAELEPMNRTQIRYHDPEGQAVAEALTEAVNLVDRATELQIDSAVTARAGQIGDDLWPARFVLLDGAGQNADLAELMKTLNDHHQHTGTAVVMTAAPTAVPEVSGVEIELTGNGRLRIAAAGLDLVAVGLTSDEAQGCAALLAQSENLQDTDVPHDEAATEGWAAYANAAGALRAENIVPRDAHDEEETSTLLDGQDDDYLQHGATTEQDLATLSPQVPAEVTQDVLKADPTLDQDLADWHATDCPLPRLTLLGPVRARTNGDARAVMNRVAYYTEMLAYLVLRPYGSTSAQLAEAFNIKRERARVDIHTLREWLGVDPRTGEKHVPDAIKSPQGKERGMGVYQALGILVDLDLFRRLRVRATARGGEDGVADLRAALDLVTGTPFDSVRDGGWNWLYEGDRIDHHMTNAVVDVAHTVTTWGLHTGELRTARVAAECAALAAPDAEIPRLDLAAVAEAEGNEAEARRIVDEDVTNRSDDGRAPQELSVRTKRVITTRKWNRAS